MAIERLGQPCWYASRPGSDEDDWHHASEIDTAKSAKELREDEPDAEVKVGQHPDRCFIVTCDGDCEDHPEDEECWNAHCPTRAAAEQWAESCGWIVTRDGRVFCEDDAPECALADLAVTTQIPGQLTLEEAANA